MSSGIKGHRPFDSCPVFPFLLRRNHVHLTQSLNFLLVKMCWLLSNDKTSRGILSFCLVSPSYLNHTINSINNNHTNTHEHLLFCLFTRHHFVCVEGIFLFLHYVTFSKVAFYNTQICKVLLSKSSCILLRSSWQQQI